MRKNRHTKVVHSNAMETAADTPGVTHLTRKESEPRTWSAYVAIAKAIVWTNADQTDGAQSRRIGRMHYRTLRDEHESSTM